MLSSVSPLSRTSAHLQHHQQHSAEAVRAGAEDEEKEEDAAGETSEDTSSSNGPLCGDGWTRKGISIVIGCGNQGRDMELRSACEEDQDFPKGK